MIDYFGRPAYLAQSPQFYKQIMVGVFERVYEIGPVFRAEPHDTPRQLSKFVSLDAELGFIRDHTTVMEMLTEVLRGMRETVRAEARGALSMCHADSGGSRSATRISAAGWASVAVCSSAP